MNRIFLSILIMVSFLLYTQLCFAKKSGNQLILQHGIVQSAKVVKLDSEAAKGALLGGAVGLWSANGKKNSKKWRNTLAGAAAGGVLKSHSEGDRRGMEYVVDVNSGTTIRIISDQSEIRVGDCVTIEQSGKTANIRREPSTTCQEKSQAIVQSLEKEFEKEANECLAAKKQLLDAKSDKDVDTALRKVQILCNN
jgi:hypothetical protein